MIASDINRWMAWLFRAALASVLLMGSVLPAISLAVAGRASGKPRRPNILLIVAEDHGPMLGVYGDGYAVTPTLDALAGNGIRYTNAYTNAPVCTPSRATLITGVYAPSSGGHNHMGVARQPATVPFLGEYLREAGYFTVKLGASRFNLYRPASDEGFDQRTYADQWDTAAYKQTLRHGPRPFFAMINLPWTHEGQVANDGGWFDGHPVTDRPRGHTQHDPRLAPVPPYWPDTPTVREDIAQYYDNVSQVDGEVARVLKQIQQEGWAQETVVFYLADHGNGLPRGKRWLYDSGVQVPFIVSVPERYRELLPRGVGHVSNERISFVDFAPTVLSLAGIPIPAHMQGRAFLGPQRGKEPPYVYGYRDRTDERFETIRSVRDGRYLYIRNYRPELPYAQHLNYVYEVSAVMREWQRLHVARLLTPVQDAFFAPSKPTEELYDTTGDPYQIHNLAAEARYREVLSRMRAAQAEWSIGVRDLGLIPEGYLQRLANGRAYPEVTQSEGVYPAERVVEAATLAGERTSENLTRLQALMRDQNGIVRYWGALGVSMLGEAGQPALNSLESLLNDPVPDVRIVAAQALCALESGERALPVLAAQLTEGYAMERLAAANALGSLGERIRGVSNVIRKAFQELQASGGIDRGENLDAVYSRDYLQATLREHREQIQWALKDLIVNLER